MKKQIETTRTEFTEKCECGSRMYVQECRSLERGYVSIIWRCIDCGAGKAVLETQKEVEGG